MKPPSEKNFISFQFLHSFNKPDKKLYLESFRFEIELKYSLVPKPGDLWMPQRFEANKIVPQFGLDNDPIKTIQ